MVLSSTKLLDDVPVNPMPKLFPGAKNPFPIVRFARSRFSFEPEIHMPPQAAVRCPFRIETLRSTTLLADPPETKMPDMQLVATVTSAIVPPVVLSNWMPKFLNCSTLPGPRIITSFRPFARIPISPAVDAPEQPV